MLGAFCHRGIWFLHSLLPLHSEFISDLVQHSKSRLVPTYCGDTRIFENDLGGCRKRLEGNTSLL
jgi:hypothetical protein